MPGVNHWKKVENPQPLPLVIRVMPGRPKSKKKKKEKGEDVERHPKRSKRIVQCSNCGFLGHNKKTCKKPNATATKNNTSAQGGRPPTSNDWINAQRSKKAERNRKKYVPENSRTTPETCTTKSTAKTSQRVEINNAGQVPIGSQTSAGIGCSTSACPKKKNTTQRPEPMTTRSKLSIRSAAKKAGV